MFLEAVERGPPVQSEDYYEQIWRFFRLTGEDLGPVSKYPPWFEQE